MDETAVIRYITSTFASVAVATASGDSFFTYDPNGDLPPDRWFPFATLVTGDHYERVSNLDRPSVFRLNIGVSRNTYLALFGSDPPGLGPDGVVEAGHDFTALDAVMPHPIYAPQFWVCVLSPSDATFQETVQPLLAEAYKRSVNRLAKLRPEDEP